MLSLNDYGMLIYQKKTAPPKGGSLDCIGATPQLFRCYDSNPRIDCSLNLSVHHFVRQLVVQSLLLK